MMTPIGPKTERQIMESGSLGAAASAGSTPAVVAKVSYFRDEGSRDAEFHIKPLADVGLRLGTNGH